MRSCRPKGHLDGDGYPDLVVPYGRAVQLLRNDRGQGFVDESWRIERTHQLVGLPLPGGHMVDLDNDGDRDLILNALEGHTIWRNDAGALRLARESAWQVVPIDIDSDGDLDLLSARQLERNVGGLVFQAVTVDFPFSTVDAQVVDLDGDGDRDVTGSTQLGLYVVINHNGTLIEETAARLRGAALASAPTAADFDGDGDVDLALNANGSVQLYRNGGAGVFTLAGQVLPVVAQSKIAADLDGDGDTDLAVAPGNPQDAPALCYNDGSGVFTVRAVAAAPICAVDVDRDGDIDVVGRHGSQGATTLYSNLDRHVFAERIGFVGTELDLRWSSRPQRASAGDSVTPLLAAGLAATPLELPGLGTLLLPVTRLVALPTMSLPAPAGTLLQRLAIPAEAGLIGAGIAVQGAFATTAGIRMSNATLVEFTR